MTAIIWTLPDCPNCDEVEKALRAEGYEIDERDGERLVKAPRRDEVGALAQLAEQGGTFPVVMVDGEFRRPGNASMGEWD